MRGKLNKNGFTLIELLLGFLIFGLVMGAVVSVFWAGLKMNERGAKQNKSAEEARRTLEWIVHDLENMVDFDMSSMSQDRTAFIGEKNKITFVWPSSKGLKSVSYYLEEPSRVRVFQTIMGETTKKNKKVTESTSVEYKNLYLIRDVRDFAAFLSGSNLVGEKEVMFTHAVMDGIVFKYAYARDKDSRDIVWRDKWEENYMPMGIQVELSFQENVDTLPITLTRKILVPAGTLGGVDKAKQSQSNQSQSNIFQNLFQNTAPQNSGGASNTIQVPVVPMLPESDNQSAPQGNDTQGNGINLQQILGQFLNQQPSQ